MSWLPLPSSRPFARTFAVGAALLLAVPSWAADPVVKLLGAGNGEKKELRVAPKPGTSETFQMVMNMDMTMDMGGMGQIPQTVPPIVMVMTADVKSVDANGDIHYSYTLADASVGEGADPTMAKMMTDEMKKMVGTKGTVVVSNRGFTKQADLIPAPGLDPEQLGQMQKSMQHASAPFPVEPVGVGAKWQVSQNIEDNGLKLNQVTTYTLTERTGDVVVLQAELVQKADGQSINAAGLPPGATASLESFESAGSGTSTLSMGHLFPTASTLKHGMKTRMKINAQGQEMSMGMSMNLGLEMGRK